MSTLLQDLRYAARTLRRSPGFAAVAILTLALGIGATTAIFSAVNGVLLRPLPYQDPGRLVRLIGTTRGEVGRGTVSYPDILDWREHSNTLSEVAAYDEWTATLTGDGPPERVHGASVTSPFFRVLGVRPALGRFFRTDEDRPGHEPAVVLSHGLWQRRYGADPEIIGRQIEVNNTRYTVVGIAPADYEDPELSGASYSDPVLWRVTPTYFNPEQASRDGRSFTAIGRLAPGATLDQAQSEMSAISRRLAELYPEDNLERGVQLVRLKEEIVGPVRPALLVLFAAAALVLLIACANMANLLLARASGRERELAVRTALGASRGRLLWQMLTESVILSLLGGALGVVLAIGMSDALVVLGGGELARAEQIRVNGWVLGFATGASLLTGLLFGLVPALRSSAASPQGALREGSRDTGGRTQRGLRDALVAGEVALAIVLLVGAGLFIRSLWTLLNEDVGLRTENVLTLEINPPFESYDSDGKITQLYDRILSEIASLPEVNGVATTDILPMSGSFNGMGFSIDSRPPPPPGEGVWAEMRAVTPGFFSVLEVPTVGGRSFSEADHTARAEVAVIDEAMAARYWPDEDPIGQRITLLDTSWEIVGVVGNIRQFALDRAPEPTFYLPRSRVQEWQGTGATLILRTAGDPLALASAVRETIWSLDRNIPISDIRTMEQVVTATASQPRFRTALLALFAGIAFLLGAVGIYGVVSYAVSRRTSEMGIRIALGARPGAILGLVIRQGMLPVVIGAAAGLVVSLVLGEVVTSFLYGVSPVDPWTLAAVTVLLGSVALLAIYLPARRATRVDPMVALRAE